MPQTASEKQIKSHYRRLSLTQHPDKAKPDAEKNQTIETLWDVFFHGTAIFLATVSLTIIYRVARPKESNSGNVLPGAFVATALWWISDITFGFYVRRVPYSVVYGGLAAVIGLLIWMQISTVIIFLGAAWNAESAWQRTERAAVSAQRSY